MESMRVLNLKCNRIGNILTPALRNMSRLIELNLGCNRICEIASPALTAVRGTLPSLILDNNCMTQAPAEALAGFNASSCRCHYYYLYLIYLIISI